MSSYHIMMCGLDVAMPGYAHRYIMMCSVHEVLLGYCIVMHGLDVAMLGYTHGHIVMHALHCASKVCLIDHGHVLT